MKPFPHQEQAHERFIDKSAMPLFFDMRLGKTLVTIRWAVARGCKKILVLAPATALVGWMELLTKLGHEYQMLAKGDLERKTWFLGTYSLLARRAHIASEQWDCVVLDESTAIKSPKSIASKLAVRKLSQADNRAILTGTVTPEEDMDAWNQMAFVNGGSWLGFSNYYSFRKAACRQYGFDWKIQPKWSLEIKKALHSEGMFLKKVDVGLGSEHLREIRSAPLHPEALKIQTYMRKFWRLPPPYEVETKQTVVLATWAHRLAGGHAPPGVVLPCWKYEELVDLLKGELQQEQVIVWCSYRMEIRRVWDVLQKEKISCTYINGDTTIPDRMKRRDLFNQKKRQVMIAQVKTGKMGFDLSGGSTMIYLSSPYSCETRQQSEERCDHPLKKEPVLIIDLISEKSIDEVVREALETKIDNLEWICKKFLSK